MKQFAELCEALDSTTSTGERLSLLTAYFREASPVDARCALALFSGWRPPRLLKSTELRALAAELSGIPLWLVEESYHFVGDLGETLALLMADEATPSPSSGAPEDSLHGLLLHMNSLRQASHEEIRSFVLRQWKSLDTTGRLIFNKLIAGSFRLGVASRLAITAFAQAFGLSEETVAHRVAGDWDPLADDPFSANESEPEVGLKPYPFCLAYPVEGALETLGTPSDVLLEYKWDGIRCQIVRREGRMALWSRGGESLDKAFPELVQAAAILPANTVLDGEILLVRQGRVMPFTELQKRIGRKDPSPTLLKKYPVVFLAFDLLRHKGEDIRSQPLRHRRALLENLIVPDGDLLRLNEGFNVRSWEEAAQLRQAAPDWGAEGIMIKHLDSPYVSGRKRHIWWKWKVDPYTVDAVLLYAQAGHGRRAGLYTDFTFALWHEGRLVPFAKAYSGLTDEEMAEVNRFIRHNTLEKFGPVRSVKPQLVFELAFESLQRSNRHKSGVAVRFPRILRWRRDKQPHEADSLQTLLNLLSKIHPE